MDKQKQIEEMAGCKGCYDNLGKCPIKNKMDCSDYRQAINRYEQGYRIIPENAVVLTKEEYKRQQKDNEDFDEFARSISDIRMKNGNKIATFKDLQDYIELQVKRGSKETAEKFAERVKMAFYYEFDELIPSIMADKIDEIAKEITGGE